MTTTLQSETGACLSILQHALGVDQYGQGTQYRYHFVTGQGSVDFAICMLNVERGFMVRRKGTELTGGDDLFLVTDAGRAWVAENSPQPPKLTRGQQRYREWLDNDSTDESFFAFCKRRTAAR